MKDFPKKIWLIVLFFLLLSLSINLLKENHEKEEVLGINNKNIEEIVIEESLNIAKAQLDISNKSVEKNEVYVPYYWKNGLNVDSKDYLLGYIPSINSFYEYYVSKNKMLLGIDPRKYNYDMEEVMNVVDNREIIFSNCILNESQYFQWEENLCDSFRLDSVGKKIFTCLNWLNWSGIELSNKSFVLTDCSVEDTDGYCLFEEYSEIYYDSKKLGEKRCFQNENEEYLCDYDEYVKQIEYN